MHLLAVTPSLRRIATRFASVLTCLIASCGVSLAAHAAPVAGDLVKLADDGNLQTTADSAVYYVGSDAKRYAFPNAQAYFTWYADFNTVKIVSSADLAALPLGGNIVYRPGTRLIKIVSDPKVYAVEPGGELRPIASESVAKALYGDAWNKKIDDVPDTFFINYTVGDALAAAVYPDGSIVKRASDGAYFRIENGTKRKIESAAVRTSLRVQEAFVLQTSSTLNEYADGAVIATAESAVTDTAQKNAAALPTMPTFSVRAPSTPYIAVGADVVLIDLSVVAPQAVTIRKLSLSIKGLTDEPVDADGDNDVGGLLYGNNAQPNFTALRLVDDAGAEPFGRKEVSRVIELDDAQTFSFDGSFAVPAGTPKRLRLIARLNGILPNDQGYKATLLTSGSVVVDNGSGTNVAVAPSPELAGPDLITRNAALEVSAAGVPGIKTYVRGTKDAALAGFVFKATTVAPNIVNGLTLQGYVDEEGTGGYLPGSDTDNGTERLVRDIVPQVSLYDDATGVKVAGPVTVAVGGTATFSGFSYAVPAGKSGTLVLKGDIPKTLDIESQPDRISFDILNPSENVKVIDETGAAVAVTGVNLNKDVTPVWYQTIKKTGKLETRWAGNGGNAVAGAEVQLGTLSFKPEDDDFTVKTVSFIQPGTVARSLGGYRLEYPISDTQKVSVNADAVGNAVVFSNLPLVVTRDKTTTVAVYGRIASRDGGAVNGETIGVKFANSGPFQFLSRSSDEEFTEDDLASVGAVGDFSLPTNTASTWLVRFTAISAEKSAGSPAGQISRTANQEVLRFALKVDPAGPARIKKFTFDLAPTDIGRVGANNDALERWADAHGDFADDDSVLQLRRIIPNEVDPLVGAESSGHIRFAIVRGGTKSETSSTLESAAGDYGVVEIEFDSGNEYFIAAGSTAEFSVFVDASAFSTLQDFSLTTTMAAGNGFLWTDVPSGAYTALTGTDAFGLGFASSLLVTQ